MANQSMFTLDSLLQLQLHLTEDVNIQKCNSNSSSNLGKRYIFLPSYTFMV